MRALLVVDVLVGIFELPVPLHQPDEFLATVRSLVERARRNGVPVIYIHHVGRPGSPLAHGMPGREIHPAIAPRPGDLVIEKLEPDGFHGTELEAELRKHEIRELIVCGFATQDCVDTTVRSAFGRGFAVTLVRGAHTTTANPVLAADQIVAHHEFVLQRFGRVVDAAEAGLEPES
ncbi:MAG TPA: cysteine hydrolase family protein [Kofleriaceae bacterium]